MLLSLLYCSRSITKPQFTISCVVGKHAFKKVSRCSRYAIGTNCGAEIEQISICNDCCLFLCEFHNKSYDYIPSASRLCLAIADCVSCGECISFGKVRSAAASVISAALETWANYFHHYRGNTGNEISRCSDRHRTDNVIECDTKLIWCEKAQMAGELFPARPLVRPNVYFGFSSRSENSRSCRKTHDSARAHTPGIFTVQCVCRHPKLNRYPLWRKQEEWVLRYLFFCHASNVRRVPVTTIKDVKWPVR